MRTPISLWPDRTSVLSGFPILLVAGAAVLATAGCGSARLVSRNQTGGVIALQGDRQKAMEQAHQEMSAHCGPGAYRIVEEGEHVVGSETQAADETYATKEGTVVTQGGSQTKNVIEWRMKYECGAPPAYYGQPAAPPAPPGTYIAPPPPYNYPPPPAQYPPAPAPPPPAPPAQGQAPAAQP